MSDSSILAQIEREVTEVAETTTNGDDDESILAQIEREVTEVAE